MKKFLLVCFSFVFALSAWAQDRVVSGKVTSPENGGEALPGVNVVLKGTTNGTVTDVSGLYKLTVPATGGTLVFSFIGHETQEIAVGDRTTVDVTMATDTKVFDEVVVTTQGIQREAKTLGYSVATVKGDLINQAKVTNLAAALSAKVSGLQINQVNNGVNGGVRVVLRGNRSFLGNNQALIVLDGVQVSSDYLNTLNPNDVESVTVLKGANAAALYGSSASNGVLVITTKVGKTGPPELTFSSTTQLNKVAFIPKLQNTFGQNGGEGPGADVFNLNYNFPYGQYVAYENQNYGPQFNGSLVQLGRPLQHPVLVNGVLTDRQMVPYQASSDHLKFFNTGVTTQNDISFSAGDATSHYYISVQDVATSGVLPKDKYRRDAIRFNGDKQYGIFNIAYKIGYTLQHTDVNFSPGGAPNGLSGVGPADNGAIGNSVYWLWMNTAQNVDLTKYKDWKNNIWASNTGWYDDFYSNPYFSIDNNRRVTNQTAISGNLQGSVQATKWLSLVARLGYTDNTLQQTENTGPVVYDLTLANPNRYSVSQSVPTGGVIPGTTSLTYTSDKRINTDVLATATHKFGQDLTVRAIAGNNVFDDLANASNINAASLVYSDPQIYNVAYRNGNLGGSTAISRQRRISYYGDASVTWKYLTVHGSYRNDATSLLSQTARSFSYPEIDASFIFTDAIPGLKDNQFLNFGKITGSIAKVGNVSLNPYQLNTTINAGTPYSLPGAGSVPVFYLGGNVVSQSLKPEFTLSKEVTLELGLWDEKINFKTAYYQTNTTNQTVPFQVSSATGYSQALINTGEMLNKGLEFDFAITPVSTSSGFIWKVGANFTEVITNKPLSIYTSPSKDVLTSINVSDNQGNATNSYAIVGQQYPQLKTTDWKRDPQGRVIVDAVTGLPSRNPTLINAGQTNPKHRLGLSTMLSYKGFNLNILVDYRSGNVIFNNLGQNIEFGGIGYQSALAGRQRFVYPNSSVVNSDGTTYHANTNVTVNEGNYNFWQSVYNTVGTPYVTSAAFWKLREVNFGYTFPKSMLSTFKFVKNLRVSLVGRNLLMWRPKSNLWTDPEFATDTSNANGTTTTGQLPPARTYGANLTVTF
jgi:TonB-linked SusC/RagA family outer membrane protein